jgi:glycopeptide antibiotics resistance protein
MINEVSYIIQQQMKGVSLPILSLLSVCGCIIVALIYLLRRYVMKRDGSLMTLLLYLAFTIYVCALIYITLGNRELGSRNEARWIPFMNILLENGRLNILGFVLMLLNIVLFIPYGFLITLVLRNVKTLNRFIIASVDSLLLSIGIETVQRITKLGYFEVEDMICNTFGGMVGWFMASIIIFIYHIHQQKTRISLDF